MAAGAGGLRFGGVWTVVIVAQVAVALAFPAAVFLVRQAVVHMQNLEAGFPVAQYLSARLEMDAEERSGSLEAAAQSEFLTRVQLAYEEIGRRLGVEPGVAGVTFTSRLPRTVHPQRWLEIDSAELGAAVEGRQRSINTVSVAVNYFDVLGARIVSGRAFRPGDLSANSGPVIVNLSFVQRVLQGRNALGRRVRYVEESSQKAGIPAEPWHEIIGVVRDLGTTTMIHRIFRLYHPIAPGAMLPVHIAEHVRGEPGTFAARLRTVAAAVDPSLRLYDVAPLGRVGHAMWNVRLLVTTPDDDELARDSSVAVGNLCGRFICSFAAQARDRDSRCAWRPARRHHNGYSAPAILSSRDRRRHRSRPRADARRSSKFFRGVVRRSSFSRLLRRIHAGRLPACVHCPNHARAPH